MKEPYLYDGMEAFSYDLIDELSDFDDYDFYRFLIESNPGSVLDLGCGTGRILAPLASDGIAVVGLDASEEMLAICREKLESIEAEAGLVKGDIRRFELGESFQTILIPGFTIQLLIGEEDLDACLLSCARHLSPGGQLVIPTYLPWEMLETGKERSPSEKRRESEFGESGERFAAWQGWRIDTMEQLLTLENRFRKLDPNGAILVEEEREMTIRWHLPYDMQQRLTRNGFRDVSLYGDFAFDPPEPNSESVIYVARL